MKRKICMMALLSAAVLSAAGCGGKEEPESPAKEENRNMESEPAQTEEETNRQEDYGDMQQPGDDNLFLNQTTYTWEEVTISIPDAWEGKYQVQEGEDGFTLLQTASYEKEAGMGMLCGFYRKDGMAIDIPGGTPLAYTDTQTYYMAVPTDVNFYYEDEAVAAQYHEMAELTGVVAATISIDKEGVRMNPDEYVLPLSNTIAIQEEDLYNFSDNELKIARNEIYARHGRKFSDQYLAGHFDSCSWYEGTVSPEEFGEETLSGIEKDNVKMIAKAEEAYGQKHPYPKQYDAGSTAQEDLDGDGNEEKIRCVFKGEETVLVVDEKEYPLSDFGVYLSEPVSEFFYVTDISSFESGLEIALLDHGPSDDPETHFFTYQDGLSYIGNVLGFPFKELTGYNGFTADGGVTGQIRLDFTHTCRAYDYWWYDYENQKLVYQDAGYYKLAADGAHQLSEDLTVFLDMDERHLKNVLSAQKEVFFLETDGKEWVLVKGKDGTKGYIHIVDGKITGISKEPGEVFSGLDFVD